MKTDIEIASSVKMASIESVSKNANVSKKYLEPYGKYKAKINLDIYDELKDKKDGKLVLVTAINPTKYGEGKTTTTIGLSEAFKIMGVNAVLALREPSLGPVFGIKGGAAGGGSGRRLRKTEGRPAGHGGLPAHPERCQRAGHLRPEHHLGL